MESPIYLSRVSIGHVKCIHHQLESAIAKMHGRFRGIFSWPKPFGWPVWIPSTDTYPSKRKRMRANWEVPKFNPGHLWSSMRENSLTLANRIIKADKKAIKRDYGALRHLIVRPCLKYAWSKQLTLRFNGAWNAYVFALVCTLPVNWVSHLPEGTCGFSKTSLILYGPHERTYQSRNELQAPVMPDDLHSQWILSHFFRAQRLISESGWLWSISLISIRYGIVTYHNHFNKEPEWLRWHCTHPTSDRSDLKLNLLLMSEFMLLTVVSFGPCSSGILRGYSKLSLASQLTTMFAQTLNWAEYEQGPLNGLESRYLLWHISAPVIAHTK